MQTEQRRLGALETSGKNSVKIGGTALAIASVLLILGVFVHGKNKEKRTTQLIYDLSRTAQAQQALLESALARLSSSQKVWRLDSQAAVSDWKRNAGAAYNVKRESAAVRKTLPPRVESNIEPTCVDLGKLKMFFLPDQVLYWQHGTFASLDYQDLNFHSGSTQFIEEQVQASDSQQVGTTWRYVRRDGGPDRRFNNNRQLPIMVYGVLTANTPSGLILSFTRVTLVQQTLLQNLFGATRQL